LVFEAGNDGDVRLALADQRGDGRPDYLYRGRVLYADTVTPLRIAVNGGPIVIDGVGFRPGNSVTVGGLAAAITSVTPTEITAIAPASAGGVTGNVDVTVMDSETQGWTTIEGASGSGLSYGPQSSDGIQIVTAPANAVLMGVPLPFTVQAMGADGVSPASGVNVIYTVTKGAAITACGHNVCAATTAVDGTATIMVEAKSTALAVMTASLANGASVTTEFIGAAPPAIDALSPTLHLAEGAVFNWAPQAIVLSKGVPYPGQAVTWSAGGGAAVASATSVSDTNGMAWTQVSAGPLAAASVATVYACVAGGVPGGNGCASLPIVSVDPSSAGLIAVSGTSQTLATADPLAPVVLRVVDSAGDPMAGAVVTFYETLRHWTPRCPPQGSFSSGPVVATQTVEATSDANGVVILTPLTDGIVATQLEALAVIGDSAAMTISIERHP
jgi:hypothetical protein